MVAKCDDEAKNDSAPLARGDGESPRLSDRLCHFRAVRDERNASSPLPDAMRYKKQTVPRIVTPRLFATRGFLASWA